MRLASTGVIAAAACLACGEPVGQSVFDVASAPDQLRALPWKVLATDPSGDDNRRGWGDGRTFAFHHDPAGDTLWFRWELHDGYDPETPAVSVAFDTDSNQLTGAPWYGSNKDFRFEVLVSVGPLDRVQGGWRGYNGVTDSVGVVTQSWMNRQQGGLVFYTDAPFEAYYLGVARSDVSPALERFNVIGSVGRRARWNDDIGSGFASVDLLGSPSVPGA